MSVSQLTWIISSHISHSISCCGELGNGVNEIIMMAKQQQKMRDVAFQRRRWRRKTNHPFHPPSMMCQGVSTVSAMFEQTKMNTLWKDLEKRLLHVVCLLSVTLIAYPCDLYV